MSVLTLYKSKYGKEGMKNVVMMNKRSITEKIYTHRTIEQLKLEMNNKITQYINEHKS